MLLDFPIVFNLLQKMVAFFKKMNDKGWKLMKKDTLSEQPLDFNYKALINSYHPAT